MTHNLNTQKELLWDEVEKIETQRNEFINSKLTELFDSISDIFGKFEIQISSETNIYFRYKENNWYNFNIYRSYDWHKGTYYNEYISCGSYSDKTDEVFIMQMAVGKIAEHFLYKDEKYKQIFSLMDEYVSYEKDQLTSLRSQIREIDKQIDIIKKEEHTKAFNDVFNKGTFKLNKKESFYYGNGKWDRVMSSEFFWEANPSGKTYNLFYIDEYRTNNSYDEEGNYVEPVYATRKCALHKKVKKADIESFVCCNMNKILVEEAVQASTTF